MIHNYLEFSLELEDMGLPGSCLVLKLGFLLTGEMKWASSGDIFLRQGASYIARDGGESVQET